MKASLPILLACLWLAGCTTFTRPADDAASGDAALADAADAAGSQDAVLPADAQDAADASDAVHGQDALPDAADTHEPDAADTADPDALLDAHEPDADSSDAADAPAAPDADVATPDSVSCVGEPCVTPGLTTCSDGGASMVRVCAAGPNGCLDWTDGPFCDNGQECRKGNCGVDSCPFSGALDCDPEDPSAYRICSGDGKGFLAWGAPLACPADSLCKDGSCGENVCQSEGSTACFGAAQTIVCLQDPGGFLVWGVPEACPDGGVCKAGVCGKDTCAYPGQVECVDQISARTCESDPIGFLSWGDPVLCKGDCAGGKGCGSVCEPGDKVCAGPTSAVTCQDSPSGPYWSEPLSCPKPTVCKGAGLCGTDQCLLEGTFACSTTATDQRIVCALKSSGFLEWKPATPCAEGEECRPGGHCGTDECELGQVACIDPLTSLAQSCELQADGFYRWDVPFTCPTGSFCLSGAGCVPNGPIALSTAALASAAGPAVAPLPGGGTLVAWASAGAPDRIVTRRVDAAGNPLGGAEQPLSSGDDAQSEPAVATAADGSALVAWTEAAAAGSIVRAALVSAKELVAPAVTLSDLGTVSSAATVTALPGGGYYVFWQAEGGSCTGPRCIMRRLVTAVGIPKGDPSVALDEGQDVALSSPSAVALASGGVWLSMSRLEAAPGLCDLPACPGLECCENPGVLQAVQAMRFAPGGSPELLPTLLEIVSGATLSAGQVTTGPEAAGARIAWIGQPTSTAKGVQFRCLADGGASCATTSVGKGGGTSHAAAAIAPRAGGAFVVAWTGLVGSTSAQHVFTRVVGADGAPLLDPRQASLGLVGTHARPAILQRTDSANVVVWEVHDSGSGASSVRLRILEE